MNIKGNLKYIITGSVVFLVIYMFVAAIPMGYDISFAPMWTKDLGAATEKLRNDPEAKPDKAVFSKPGVEAFILGNRFGYFTPKGDILSCAETEERVTASPQAWAVYPQNARDTRVFLPDGTAKMTIAESGYVHLDGKRTYLFLPGGDSVSQYSDSGKPLWTREHTAPITAFNSSPAGAIIGYADGKLSCIRPDGSEAFSFYPGGSNFQIIQGAALSEDGTLAACVSGIDKQRFILISIKGDQYKIIYHIWLQGNLRRQVFVDFEKNSHFAFFESAQGLGIVNCKKRTAGFFPVEGQVFATGDCPGESLFVVLSGSGQNYTLSAVERPDHLIASAHFRADNAFLIQRESAIYLGTDNRISRIDIRGLK